MLCDNHSLKCRATCGCEVTSDQIMLPADDAIPMALLANELMTNAYKHAFPDGASGEITIDLRCAPENAADSADHDNGIGMRPSNGESGLGVELIRTLRRNWGHAGLCRGRPMRRERWSR